MRRFGMVGEAPSNADMQKTRTTPTSCAKEVGATMETTYPIEYETNVVPSKTAYKPQKLPSAALMATKMVQYSKGPSSIWGTTLRSFLKY